MKILQIIPSLAKGGAERIVLDICNELLKRDNIEIRLVIFHNINDYQFLTNDIDLTIIPSGVVPSILGKSIVEVQDLQNFIDEYKPDIIHSHLFESEIILSHIEFKNASHFVHFHDNMKQFANFSFQTLVNKEVFANFYEKMKVEKGYYKRVTTFIAISSDSFHFINSTLSSSFPKILLYNSIDLKRFMSLNQAHQKNKLVIIGSLVNKKGQDLAIETIKVLHERSIKIHLDILGNGPDFERLQTLINSYSLNDFITLHGNVDHPETFLNEATIYLHTAIYEPFGLVLIEAMASGLPIVCTDAKGNRDIIKEGENGFMIKERNPFLIADKIELLLNDDVLWKSISEKTVEMSKQFDISHYVDKLLNLYQL